MLTTNKRMNRAGRRHPQHTVMARLEADEEVGRLRVQVASAVRAANCVMPKFNKISPGGQDAVGGWLSRDLYDVNRLLRQTIEDIDIVLDRLDYCYDIEREP
jgi:hypothetical protein